MKRIQLRQLILEELNNVSEGSFTGGFTTNMPDNIPTTAQVMDQMRDSDDVGEFKASGHSNDDRPLNAGELIALMTADKDPNSDYKLSIERLQSLSYGNLSGEELDIVS